MAPPHGANLMAQSAWIGKDPHQFADPFMSFSSMAMPTNIDEANRWCEFIICASGVYRSAISRVIAYFITDIDIKPKSDGDGKNRIGKEEKQQYVDFLEDKLNIKTLLQTIALDFMCFHGDTVVPTRDGVYKIRDLAGRTVDVISKGGVYRPAEFKRFGRQQLMEVTFADGRTALATPEHEWLVQKSTGGYTKVPTTELAGRRIRRTVAPRPEKNEDYYEGVRHGFTFGDGSIYNKDRKTPKAAANFFGAKTALIPYFEGHGTEAKQQRKYAYETLTVEKFKSHGLPAHYKELPSSDESASYWYGFVCGFMAADGSVDTYGCALLTQKSEATIRAIEAQLPRLGMVGGPVRSQDCVNLMPAYKGVQKTHQTTAYIMTLLKQFMCADDFILQHHRDNFLRCHSTSNYGKYIGVKSVEYTGIVDDVYCCVEPETHSFVIGNGILTGNCYGNSFTSVLMPFRRYLACPKCGFESPLAKIANAPQYGYKFSNFEFTATCTHCKYSGVWRHIDRRSGSSGAVSVKRWSPHEMAICYDKFTGMSEYIWKIPEDYRAQIRRGELFQLEKANWEVVETIKQNQHLWFDKDVVYHMKEMPLAGIRAEGWGISRVLANFRQAWYVQLLHAYNEALALDYIIPFRVITPAPRRGGGSNAEGGSLNDPLLNMNMGDFTSRVKSMIAARRRDPAQWNVLPSPIEYQALGGDATQLAPSELLELGMDTLLTSIGVPVEMYKGSLSVQAAPAALRLFEANWSHLVHAMNQQLAHIVQRVGEIFNWEPVTASLVRVTHADDLNRQMAKLQLMMGGQISRTTGLSSVGIDFAEEERTKLDEERVVSEETEKAQAEMDQQASIAAMSQGPPPSGPVTPPPMPGMPGQMPTMQGMPGAMPGGGAPAPPAPAGGDPAAAGGAPPAPGAPTGAPPANAAQSFGAQQMPTTNQPTTVEEMQNQASTIAQQAMALPETQRKSYLIQLRKENPVMADLVQSQLDDMRYQARMQGGDMLMQQQQQAAQQQPQAMPQQ